jgi:hypothetical protein
MNEFGLVVAFFVGYWVGHSEGLRCGCPKRLYPWLRYKYGNTDEAKKQ